MKPNDVQQDAVLGALRELRAHDVSAARAARLRRECHDALRRQHASTDVSEAGDQLIWPRALRIVAGTRTEVLGR